MDHEPEAAGRAQDAQETHEQPAADTFVPVPPESDDQSLIDEVDDDSDAPIRLDDLAAAEPVRAESVTLSQASAQSIDASTVSITQGAAARVTAGEFSVHQGAVAMARAENLTVQPDSSVFAVYAESATVEPGANVFMLLTRSLTGEVRPVLDWRAALGVGAGFALALSILRRIR